MKAIPCLYNNFHFMLNSFINLLVIELNSLKLLIEQIIGISSLSKLLNPLATNI
jgi:hypothetical protein